MVEWLSILRLLIIVCRYHKNKIKLKHIHCEFPHVQIVNTCHGVVLLIHWPAVFKLCLGGSS